MKIQNTATCVTVTCVALVCLTAACGDDATPAADPQPKTVRVERLLDAPIITPATHPSIGANIQGPSLIRVPAWVENPLGRYYLYFADHKGAYIRLAYADDVLGPWKIHAPGSLQIADSHFPVEPPPIPSEEALEEFASKRASEQGSATLPHSTAKEATAPHIASPDVHVDDENRQIIMYFHGLEAFGKQSTRVALSPDGIRFQARPEVLGKTYMRAFEYNGMTYGITMPGLVYRSKNGLTGFEAGPQLFNPNMRHCALLRRGDLMHVFWTQVGDAPESILLSTIDLSKPWMEWTETGSVTVLKPERAWEGADKPVEPSIRSVAYEKVNQLRDPAIFEDDGRIFLLYAVAGEAGIAIAEVFLED